MTLTENDMRAEATAVTVDGSDVYMIGRRLLDVGYFMLIWKNGVLVQDDFLVSSFDFNPNSISIDNGKFIVAASLVYKDEETSSISADATLWYDNEFHMLADGDSNGVRNVLFANKVVVVPD